MGGRLELSRLGFLHSASSDASVSMAGGGVGLELSVLRLQYSTAVNTGISGRGSSLALELTRLNGPVVTELTLLGLGPLVSLVSTNEAASNLGGTEGLLGEKGIGNLCVLFLRGARGAPDVVGVFLEGLEVQGKATS